tara:strand:+ start:1174 stop:1635 length:462 start_codon:yes stop_codon:yes gene_type:complete
MTIPVDIILRRLKNKYKKEGEKNITQFEVVSRMYKIIRERISICNLEAFYGLDYKIWKKRIKLYVDQFRELKKQEKRFENAAIIIQKNIKKLYNKRKEMCIQEDTYEIDSGEYGDEEFTEEELDELEKINRIEYTDQDISYNTFYWDSITRYL